MQHIFQPWQGQMSRLTQSPNAGLSRLHRSERSARLVIHRGNHFCTLTGIHPFGTRNRTSDDWLTRSLNTCIYEPLSLVLLQPSDARERHRTAVAHLPQKLAAVGTDTSVVEELRGDRESSQVSLSAKGPARPSLFTMDSPPQPVRQRQGRNPCPTGTSFHIAECPRP